MTDHDEKVFKELAHHWLISRHASTPKLSVCDKPNPVDKLLTMFKKHLQDYDIIPSITGKDFMKILQGLGYKTDIVRVKGTNIICVLLNSYIIPKPVLYRCLGQGRPRNVDKTEFV